jgi:uncharacterized protein (DUF305 family)
MNVNRLARTATAVLAAGALIAGCSSDAEVDVAGVDEATVNEADEADVAFAQGMIPHHAQALDMAGLVAERTSNPEIVALAKQIEAAQDPEIQLMSAWLAEWGEEVPDPDAASDHGSMDHGSGMMTAAQMAELEAADGDEFDRLFLELMIEHHEGAIAMSEDVLARGAHPGVKDLAGEIIAAQQAEIDHMRSLLGEDVAGPAATRVEIAHIHGLGVADRTLYVATHHGLVAVSPDGAADTVGTDDHDFMGFAVMDDGTFLASGHPGSHGGDLPSHLGLLESTDEGESWTPVSLLGEVDFHALDAKGGAVYGYDSVSGQLMSSTDRTSWERLGRIPLADVAISPDDSSVVLITTEAGPQLSRDAGRTFEVLAGAPLLMLVDWVAADELYGIGPDGSVHHSADGGSAWTARGGLGAQPHAMTVGPDGAVYAATEHAIVVSTDGGQAFEVLYPLH